MSFPAILVHVMNQHAEVASVQEACSALVAVLSRLFVAFLNLLQQMGAHDVVSAALLLHEAHEGVQYHGSIALALLEPLYSGSWSDSCSDVG